MKRIDKETVQRILDAADIVEVVSDFVSLKRRGANYIGLCPFHNERTPSFSVSKAKGICKCFSCGKGGSPVNFIMEHEQMTFNEALRYLAKKYNIEIKEHDVSDAEREEESARENMFKANEMALRFFEDVLLNTDEGRDIGLAYFRERGISDAAIKRFHLGFSPERSGKLIERAKSEGINEKWLVDTGLLSRRDDGEVYERFRGRVMYPVHTISGKVVAFGGRILTSDKKKAKYINSPESIIYSKSRELYGLFQAKRSIVEKKKCILVEGYMDVISMSQSGIENVVASSGTSLTEGQIRLIHRFTENVTVIYDSDPAGIKASLRGIDMLLADGLNIKVVLLPEGDDPDSFAQTHTSAEVEQYIAEHETDFIRFKTDILLRDASDPIARAGVITDIVRSISVIPNEITRSIYAQECSRAMGISEKVLLQQIKKFILERVEQEAKNRQRKAAHDSLGDLSDRPETPSSQVEANDNPGSNVAAPPAQSIPVTAVIADKRVAYLRSFEYEIVRLAMKYGMIEMPYIDEYGNITDSVYVLDYLLTELESEKIVFSNDDLARALRTCCEIRDTSWTADRDRFITSSLQTKAEDIRVGEDEIRRTANTLEEIQTAEKKLEEAAEEAHQQRIANFTDFFIIKILASSPDNSIRQIATDVADSKYHLSKVHSKYSKIETERDRLIDRLPRAIYGLKNAIVECEVRELREQLRQLIVSGNSTQTAVNEIMRKITLVDEKRRQYGFQLGERVLAPHR